MMKKILKNRMGKLCSTLLIMTATVLLLVQQPSTVQAATEQTSTAEFTVIDNGSEEIVPTVKIPKGENWVAGKEVTSQGQFPHTGEARSILLVIIGTELLVLFFLFIISKRQTNTFKFID